MVQPPKVCAKVGGNEAIEEAKQCGIDEDEIRDAENVLSEEIRKVGRGKTMGNRWRIDRTRGKNRLFQPFFVIFSGFSTSNDAKEIASAT